LRLRADGRVVLALKSAWTDVTRQLLFEPLTLLEKLAALIPRPPINPVLYHGVLAPHCGWRARVVTYGGPLAVASPCSEATDAARSAPRHWAWAALMRRAFDVDVLACPRCGGRRRLIARSRTLMRYARFWWRSASRATWLGGRRRSLVDNLGRETSRSRFAVLDTRALDAVSWRYRG